MYFSFVCYEKYKKKFFVFFSVFFLLKQKRNKIQKSFVRLLLFFSYLHTNIMPYVCKRRRRYSRHRYFLFLLTLSFLFILSLIFRSDRTIISEIANLYNNHSRLYCILVHTHSSHERFIQLSNLTWGKNCYKIGVARFRKVQKSDDGRRPVAHEFSPLFVRNSPYLSRFRYSTAIVLC